VFLKFHVLTVLCFYSECVFKEVQVYFSVYFKWVLNCVQSLFNCWSLVFSATKSG